MALRLVPQAEGHLGCHSSNLAMECHLQTDLELESSENYLVSSKHHIIPTSQCGPDDSSCSRLLLKAPVDVPNLRECVGRVERKTAA